MEVALVQDTYHRGDSDAMTYRSFVDPSQPRPAPQLYQPLGQGMHRGQDVDIHSPTFTIQVGREYVCVRIIYMYMYIYYIYF